MKRNEHHLKAQLAQLTETVRKKYREFKDGTVASEEKLVKRYKPLIAELKKGKDGVATKMEIKPEETPVIPATDETYDEAFLPSVMSTPKFIDDGTVLESGPSNEPEVVDVLSTPEGRETASKYIKETFKHPLTQKYMKKLMSGMAKGDRGDAIDHIYGPRYSEGTLMVGDKALAFDDNGSIRIGDVSYRPTEGLYELLFKRLPDERLFTTVDLNTYSDILKKSNAHKLGYRYEGRINRLGNSAKYKTIINQLFPPKTKSFSGHGMAWKTTGSRDLVHWDDPNELVERFRVLVASTETGNRAHKNEMLNIVEELREAGLIKGTGNKRFNSLLQ